MGRFIWLPDRLAEVEEPDEVEFSPSCMPAAEALVLPAQLIEMDD